VTFSEAVLAWVLLLHLGFVAWAMLDVWRRKPVGAAAAVAESILVWVPLLGPLAYLWLTRAPSPRHPELKGSGVSSDFTHTMISMTPHYQAAIESMEKPVAEREAECQAATVLSAESSPADLDTDETSRKH